MRLVATCFFTLSLLLLGSPPLLAQQAGTDLSFVNYTDADGLPSNSVRDIAKDSTGLLWFATDQGLARFDGYRFRVYQHNPADLTSLAHNDAACVLVDDRDRVWVGMHEGGIGLLDQETERFTNFYNDSIDDRRLPHNQVIDIAQRADGTILLATMKGLAAYDEAAGRFTNYQPAASVGVAAEDFARLGDVFTDAIGAVRPQLNLAPASSPPAAALLASLNTWAQFYYQDLNHARAELTRRTSPEAMAALWPIIKPLLQTGIPDHTGRNPYANLTALHADAAGNVYLGYLGGGVGVLAPGQLHPRILQPNQRQRFVARLPKITSLWRDLDTLYLGTAAQGIQALHLPTGQRVTHQIRTPATSVYDIKARGGLLYLASTNGLVVYNPTTGRTQIHDDHQKLAWAMPTGECAAVLPDTNGVIWVGHWAHGLTKASPAPPISSHPAPGAPPLPYYMRSVSAVAEDAKGRLWVGYFEGGVRQLDARGFAERSVDMVESSAAIERTSIFTIFESRTGTIWAGGYESGLLYFDELTQRWKPYRPSLDLLGGMDVRAIVEDRAGRLYVAVHGIGLVQLEPATGQAKLLPSAPGAALNPYVHDLYIDAADQVWIASAGGIFRYAEGVIAPVLIREEGRSSSFRHHAVTITGEAAGAVWVGTKQGLVALDGQGRSRKEIELPAALMGAAVNNVQVANDGSGDVWVSRKNQLYRYTPGTGDYTVYAMPWYFGVTHFRRNASLQLRDGRLLYGYDNGFISFDPKDLPAPVTVAAPRVTTLSALTTGREEQPAIHGREGPLELPHDNLGLTIDLSALHYAQPEAVTYQARILPLQREWRTIEGDQPRFTLYHLAPGDHRLEFRARLNGSPAFSATTALMVCVSPAWYASNWAFLGYGLLILATFYAYRQYVKRRAALQQSLAVAGVKAEQASEIARAKADFFTNVSHELRTPLTLIDGPLRELMARETTTPSQRQRLYQLMERNTTRLRRLVDRLLEVQKLESGTPELLFEQGDVVAYLRMLAESFQPRARAAGIDLRADLPRGIIPASYSPEVLDRVCINLLANALKYTGEGGRVDFMVRIVGLNGHREIHLSVADNGPGISAADQALLFKRFYRGENTPQAEGTGVGLSIVKQYVELLEGSIDCVSAPGEGTTFTCRLPLPAAVAVEETAEVDAAVAALHETPTNAKKKTGRPHILLVDDDADVRELLRYGCEPHFDLSEAADGEAALDLAREVQPDLVLTDLAMPVLDGVGLCQALKSDPATSHLPVLLLTAHHNDEARKLALAAGANDYLTKPFEVSHVVAKITNTLATLDAARRIWVAQPSELSEDELTTVDADTLFLQQLRSYIEENMDTQGLETDDLLRHLAVSRSVCYTKVKALTGLPLKAFIKQLRINRAQQLLAQTDLAIGEVAYKTGFKTTQHFSRTFKELAGASPSKFREGLVT